VIPVGVDCRCGHPLVWRDGEQWCSVYGTHGGGLRLVRSEQKALQAERRRLLEVERKRRTRRRLMAAGLTSRGTPVKQPNHPARRAVPAA
jgi:uncharacterized Zn finger protein (UPF0148 family)